MAASTTHESWDIKVSTAPHLIPSLYLEGYLNGFEDVYVAAGGRAASYGAGDWLTQYGMINNTAFFILEGVVQLSLGHDNGRKSLMMFGPGTVFPVGVELHEFRIDYDLMLQALSDVRALKLPYPKLKRLVQENGAFAGELLRENCDCIGYIFFDTINQTFEPCLTRLSDILYLYLTKIQPASNTVRLSQHELSELAGTSRAQTERCMKALRDEGVLETSRGKIYVIDRDGLREHCTLMLRSHV